MIIIPEIFRLLSIEPFEINTKEDFERAVESVVYLLNHYEVPSWQPGFRANFNVTYRIVNERLETKDFRYEEAVGFQHGGNTFFEESIKPML